MATAAFLLVSAGLFTVVAGEYCRSYIRGNEIMPSVNCYNLDCCGTCDDRKCCYIYLNFESKLSEADQAMCDLSTSSTAVIVSGIVGLLFTIAVFIVCCCCPCCCIYKMCKKPRPVAGPQITTVMSTQCIQQQNTSYQPVPTQQGYGVQPVHMGPAYQGQPCAPGPPPSYHMAVSPGYPYQPGCSSDQAAMQPHMQPGNTALPSEISSQPAYNPAYMQPPKPGY